MKARILWVIFALCLVQNVTFADTSHISSAVQNQLQSARSNGGRYAFVQMPPSGISFAQLAAAAAAFIRAGLHWGTISPLAQQVFGEVGAIIGQTAEWVAQNWTHIGPLMEVAGQGLGVTAVHVGTRLLAFAPTVLVGLTAAGLLTVAVYQARIAATIVEHLNQGREWQMEQAQANTIRPPPRRGVLRLPAFLDNSADIFITGPSAYRISEQAIQNYIQRAFTARALGTARSREVASNLLMLIADRALDDDPDSDP